jgi:membrane-anchored protein YejM (alkaline phosphatase superfamily)
MARDFVHRSNDPATDALPWLMFISVPAPHNQFQVESSYQGASVGQWEGNPALFDDLSDKPDYVRARASKACDLACGKGIRAGQYRTLYSVDDLVASLFDLLDKKQASDNTLAFFVSDNGLNWGEYGLSGKRYPYTSSVKIPLLMRWPQELAPRADHRLVANIDIVPTILDAADIDPPAEVQLDGLSLLNDEWNRRRLLLEHSGVDEVPTWASIRTKRIQYIEYYEDWHDQTPFEREYYDLRVDKWQLNNLLADRNKRQRPAKNYVQVSIENLSRTECVPERVALDPAIVATPDCDCLRRRLHCRVRIA